LNKKAEFLAKFHEKCPHCERHFHKSKSSIDRKAIEKMVNSWFNGDSH